MFIINEDNSIYVTRGDAMAFGVEMRGEDGERQNFLAGDVVRLKVYAKKNTSHIVLQKEVIVAEESESVVLYLSSEDTKFDNEISKPKDYWYEVELNPDGDTQTIIGFDEDGAKLFILFPEGGDFSMEGESK